MLMQRDRPSDLRAVVLRALEGVDGAGKLAAAAALEQLATELRAGGLGDAILAYVAKNPGASSNRITEHAPGERGRVLAKLKQLEAAGLLRWEPGPKRARQWYATKTSRDSLPIRGCA
jgi:hypothetical protein